MLQKDMSTITRFCLFFVKRFRVTILLIISILLLGGVSYSTFLQREGFPEIKISTGVVQIPYFVNDIQIVAREITDPVEQVLRDIDEVQEVVSTTDDNFAVFVIEFPTNVSSTAGIEIVRDEITLQQVLPAQVTPEYIDFSSGEVFGADIILSLYQEQATTPDQLEQQAALLVDQINQTPEVKKASVTKLINEQVNPITNEVNIAQTRFHRVGINQEGVLKFYPAIAIEIFKQETIDITDFSQVIHEQLDVILDTVEYQDYLVEYTTDTAEIINDQISSLEGNAISGLLIVVLVVFLFISWRAAVLAGLFMPIVMAATFIALYLLGYTLNVIVLFSLILVLGLFVDDAIVVIEAIDYKKRTGAKGIDAVATAINDIGIADVAGTITTVLVFAPVLFTTGVLGDFIRLVPVTVIVALVLSLLIALAFIPFLSSLLILSTQQQVQQVSIFKYTSQGLDAISKPFNRGLRRLGEGFSYFVNWYLAKQGRMALMLLNGVTLIAIGILFATRLDFSIFPTPKDVESIRIEVSYPMGTDITQAEAYTVALEDKIAEFASSIDSVDYFTADEQSLSMSLNLTEIGSRDTSGAIVADLTNALSDEPDLRIRIIEESAGPPSEEYPFAIQIFNEDQELLVSTVEAVREYINDFEFEDDVRVSEVFVNNIDQITRKNGRLYQEIRAKFSTMDSLTALNLQLEDAIKLEFNADRLRGLGLDPVQTFEFDFGQESENLQSFNSTIFATFAALIIMYALLVLQYNSFLLPFLVFLAIPLSFPLLFPGLFYTDNALSFFVAIGIIGMVGIVVNNTIMLVDFANQAKKNGLSPQEAIVNAVEIRTRPILTTSVTTIGGLLPLALTDPFWESLALSIIFGIVSSSILVLLIFPVFYVLVEKLRSIKSRL